MKKFLLSIIIFLSSGILYSQHQSFSPFSIDDIKTNNLPSAIRDAVDGAQIITVDYNTVNDILNAKHEQITIEYPIGLNKYTNITLKRFDVVTSESRTVTGTVNGDVDNNLKNSMLFYRGFVSGIDNSLITISFGEGFVTGILMSNKDTYVLGKLDYKNSGGDMVFYQSSKLKTHQHFDCGTEAMEVPTRIQEMMKSINQEKRDYSSATLLKHFMAVESDYETYVFYGSSVANATQYLLSLVSTVSSIYLRDINCQIFVTYLRVWDTAADPYNGTTSNALLNEFRAYWNANMGSVTRTTAHYICTRPGGLGGIAYVGVLCSGNFGYAFSDIDGTFQPLPTYSWDVMVVAHETGHNFGSPHTHSCSWSGGPIDSCYATEGGCYTGPVIPRLGTIMSYCHLTSGGIALNFGPLPSNLIRNAAEGAGCMGSLSGFLLGYPNGGEILRATNSRLIIWGTSFVGNVNIDYSTNNGTNWTTIQNNISSTLRSFTWTVPYIPTSTQSRVRVYESGNVSNGDQSDSVFQIRPNILGLNLLNPPQLNSYRVGSGDTTTLRFNWTKGGTLPEFRYTWTLTNFSSTLSFSKLSDNNGSDSTFSVRLKTIDSILTTWGVPATDSSLYRWKVRCNTTLDSLSSSNYIIIFYRGLIGIHNISSQVPKEYFIEQNYPNPFNPTTKFKFGLPKQSFVKIKVFDILGKEVVILANEKLDAGQFEVDWDASNFPSGVYFYRIEAGEYINTQKMVLMK